MFRVKYERYWNDYRRRHEEKHFSDLAELEEWIFGQMQQNYTNPSAMSFPTPKKAERIKADGPWSIEFRPVWGEENIWIHLIESPSGIVFSDGKFTSGQKHWSKAVQEWLTRCDQRQNAPKFNFAE